MTWLDGFSNLKSARERAETALYTPIGMMSPLWIAFGAAASAGATFWLMSRWVKPVNIEAAMANLGEAVNVEVVPSALTSNDLSGEFAARSPVEEPEIETLIDEPQTEIVGADDLTLLVGVGPKIAQALADRGVERFEQLAAWTEHELAAFDAALDLRGRAIRADFVGQARRAAKGEE